MKIFQYLIFVFVICHPKPCTAQEGTLNVDYLGFIERLPFTSVRIDTNKISNDEKGIAYLESVLGPAAWDPLLKDMNRIRMEKQLDDWFFYQLIRRTAQQIIPKAYNYLGYTFCKWMLLNKAGFAPLLRISQNKVLLYVMSNDSVNNIPYLIRNGQQYVCLNYHDYGYRIDFTAEKFQLLEKMAVTSQQTFSYQIKRIPDFSTECYQSKNISFTYNGLEEEYNVPMNPQMLTYFTNYPVIDYRYQFSIPFSAHTYASLIPQLKKRLLLVPPTEGVEYLMYFVRNAFYFKKDSDVFGLEKRFSPEETLVAETSDCEDRSALFFSLVKEVYQLPMIVLSFPEHVTVAVGLNPPLGHCISYSGKKYTLCEPTPQKRDLLLGEQMPQLKSQPYEVVLCYDAEKNLILSTGH